MLFVLLLLSAFFVPSSYADGFYRKIERIIDNGDGNNLHNVTDMESVQHNISSTSLVTCTLSCQQTAGCKKIAYDERSKECTLIALRENNILPHNNMMSYKGDAFVEYDPGKVGTLRSIFCRHVYIIFIDDKQGQICRKSC